MGRGKRGKNKGRGIDRPLPSAATPSAAPSQTSRLPASPLPHPASDLAAPAPGISSAQDQSEEAERNLGRALFHMAAEIPGSESEGSLGGEDFPKVTSAAAGSSSKARAGNRSASGSAAADATAAADAPAAAAAPAATPSISGATQQSILEPAAAVSPEPASGAATAQPSQESLRGKGYKWVEYWGGIPAGVTAAEYNKMFNAAHSAWIRKNRQGNIVLALRDGTIAQKVREKLETQGQSP